MLKKFISMATASILLALGMSVVSTVPASAANASTQITVTEAPRAPSNGNNFSTSMINIYDTSAGNDFSVGTRTWSPAVTNFQANTVYSVTFTITAAGSKTFPNVNANGFTLTGAGASGATVTSDAVSAGATTATITITFPDTGSGGGGANANLNTFILRNSSGLQGITISPSFSPNTTSYTATTTATTVEIQRDVSAPGSAGTVNLCNGVQGSASSTCALNLGSNTFAVRVTNGQTQKTYTITITRTASGGSSPAPSTPTLTPAQIAEAAAAAAKAAAEVAAAARVAEIATAQTALATVLRGDKAGSLSEYRAANINITTNAALTRLNAEVLKLSAADRADFAKIKAIADKIEFDETFFNATARPSLATYSSYGVTGVTERILPVINAKVLELPAALRADVKAMQELVKVESFVDRVANPATRSTVSAAVLVSRGLLNAENPRRHSIVNGLARYPEGSLNTMAKIEAAIKEQIFIAEAPKRRLAEIKARMAARKK